MPSASISSRVAEVTQPPGRKQECHHHSALRGLLVAGIFLPLQSPCKLKCGLRSVWLCLNFAQGSSAVLPAAAPGLFLPWFREGNSLRILYSRVNKGNNCSSSAWKSPEARREQKEEDPFKVLTFKRIANNLWLLMSWLKVIFWAHWREWFWTLWESRLRAFRDSTGTKFRSSHLQHRFTKP